MTSDQTGLRAAGAWLAGASLLLVLVLAFHGPLHPDLQVQMTRIAESATRWAIVHWTAAVAFSGFAVAAILVLVSGSRLTSTGRTMSAWAVLLVGRLWWSAAVGAGAGLASFAGWALGVWFDIRPANLLWVVASGVMCLWLAWLGAVLARTGESVGSA